MEPKKAKFDDTRFEVGDEVISACRSMASVILSINGDKALVKWSCRGKSTASLKTCAHTEHEYR